MNTKQETEQFITKLEKEVVEQRIQREEYLSNWPHQEWAAYYATINITTTENTIKNLKEQVKRM